MIPGLTKTRKDGPPTEAFYPGFPENPKLCPVKALRCYERKSKEARRPEGVRNHLFIATHHPHRPVKACRIGNWLKAVMHVPGWNRHAAVHSPGAATSKAKSSGLPSSEIPRAANWSSSSTFTRFYHRPVRTHQFGHRVPTIRPVRTHQFGHRVLTIRPVSPSGEL